MRVRGLAALLAFLASACAQQRASLHSTPMTEELEVITSGASAEFGATSCGQVLLSGRVVYRGADGVERPIPDARFWYQTRGGDHRTRLEVAVNQYGEFDLLSGDAHFPADAEMGSMPVVVTAEGCNDYQLDFTEERSSGTVLLICPER